MNSLMQHVQRLGPTEHREIFNIISRYDIIRYMQNNNGIFVDLTTIPDDVMQDIQKFVDYCYHNNGHLDEYNNRLVECKINQNYERLPSLTDDKPTSDNGDVLTSDPIFTDEQALTREASSENYTAEEEDARLRSSQFGFLSSVTKRMTSSKFNQAKKKFVKKKIPKMEMVGSLIAEEYPLL